MTELHIDYRLPGYNEAHNEARTHWSKAAKTKKKCTEEIAWLCKAQRLDPVEGKTAVIITWGTKGDRRDPDNIGSGIKYILDGLVLGGILESDTKKHVGTIIHRFDEKETDTRVLLMGNFHDLLRVQ